MNPKEGDIWIARNNKTFGIIRVHSDTDFPVIGIDNKGLIYKFNRKGYYIHEQFKNNLDLIQKVS